MANYTLQKGIHGGYSVIRDNPWGILGYDDISDGHLTEAEASIFAWALKAVADNMQLCAYTIEQQPIDDEGNLTAWETREYGGPTKGIAPC